MLLKPSIGRMRAAVGRGAKSRLCVSHYQPTARRTFHHWPARPSCTSSISKSIHVVHNAALRTGAVRSTVPSSSCAASGAFKTWVRKVASSLRHTVGRGTVQVARWNRLLVTHFPSFVSGRSSASSRSLILRGALSVFKLSSNSTGSLSASRTAYARLGHPFVTFARGATSGLGARPAFGSLALSPMRGGLGLQTARNFSSGGARIFDNLIVNAPLALRLAGDEAEHKARHLFPPTTRAPRRATAAAGLSRTGTTFSTANLARHALRLAAVQNKSPSMPHVTASVATTDAILDDGESTPYTRAQKQKAIETNLETYFELPSLPIPSDTALGSPSLPSTMTTTTIVTIRLVDPLYQALGGRDPLPFDITRGQVGATLLDAPLAMDVSTILHNEERRYLHAKAVLRVLWDHNLLTAHQHGAMDLFTDPQHWSVSLTGTTPSAVRQLLDAQVMFDYRPWISFRLFHGHHEVSDDDIDATTAFHRHSTSSLSTNTSTSHSSHVSTDPSYNVDLDGTSLGFLLDDSPPLSTSSLFSTDSGHNHLHMSFSGSDRPPSSPTASSLYDSRDFA